MQRNYPRKREYMRSSAHVGAEPNSVLLKGITLILFAGAGDVKLLSGCKQDFLLLSPR